MEEKLPTAATLAVQLTENPKLMIELAIELTKLAQKDIQADGSLATALNATKPLAAASLTTGHTTTSTTATLLQACNARSRSESGLSLLEKL